MIEIIKMQALKFLAMPTARSNSSSVWKCLYKCVGLAQTTTLKVQET
jgi:hypothetical protein